VKPPRANAYRDTWSGTVDGARAGDEIRVAGWVHRRRDHGGLIFIDLRDRSGLLQLVFHPETAPEAHARAHDLRSEDVITAAGTVARRDPDNVNPDLPTGEVELKVADFELLGDADTPPFPIDEEGPVDELTRLRHRALDLRRLHPRDRLLLRDRVAQTMRRTLGELDFVEIETPILTRSTPEGARDFLVPSRVNRGSFYALPQSPQLFKQLLMVAGFERYYQLARAFRDEDPRADRQPEFTQLDLEMSFVEEDDVIAVMETVMAAVFDAAGFDAPPPPWPRVPYDEALGRYGIDRPDRRFGLEIQDVSDAVAGSEFQVFAKAIQSGGVVRAIKVGAHELPRSALDELTEQAKGLGAKDWCGPTSRKAAAGARRSPSSSPTRRSPHSTSAWVRPRATCCSRWPTMPPSPRACSARCGSSWPSGSSWSPRGPRPPVGRGFPDVRVERGRGALGPAAPPVHGTERRPRRPGRAALARV